MLTKLGSFLVKNWKTTLGGLLIAVATILWQAGIITSEIFAMITAILTTLGFISAKDGDKTGV